MIFERSFGRIQRGATRRVDDTVDATGRNLLLALLLPVQLQIVACTYYDTNDLPISRRSGALRGVPGKSGTVCESSRWVRLGMPVVLQCVPGTSILLGVLPVEESSGITRKIVAILRFQVFSEFAGRF